MHIERNVGDKVVGTLLNITGKTKDTEEAHLDLEEMSLRSRDSFTMSRKQKKIFCEVLKRVKLYDQRTNSPIVLPTNLHVPIARHTTLVGANTPRASPRTKARNNQIQHTAPVAAKTPRSSPQTKARNNQIQHTAPVAAKTPRSSPQTKARNNQIQHTAPVAAKTPRSSPQTKVRNNQIQHTAPIAAKTPRASPQTKDRNNQIHVCIPCKLMKFEGDAVAKGFLKSEDPNQIVGGKKLGEGWCEVTINGGISRKAKLPRSYGKLQVIGDVLGSNVAWPRAFVKLLTRK
ncbi:uncharacterized protein LOC143855414 [Tasmannia lanceolata]|uniref:uncharacterized protein LOC143855414 n=1 Tax=Tasmannia lanceolata TaxID=3420 RepID=UPI004062B68A